MRQNGGAAVAKRKASVDGVTKMTSPLQAKDERNNNLQLSKYMYVAVDVHGWLRTVTRSACDSCIKGLLTLLGVQGALVWTSVTSAGHVNRHELSHSIKR